MLVSDYIIICPLLNRVRQQPPSPPLVHVAEEVRRQLDKVGITNNIRPGQRIAITAGSRGIANIALILSSVVIWLRDRGALPFIVPAMGSHGGATAQGQLQVLSHYGITEESMGCPILSSMEVVRLGDTPEGAPVYCDKNAWEADGIIVCNRVKPHTDFTAANESGLVKMASIGLGKAKGCSAIHSHGLAQTIPAVCRVMLEQAPIIAGLAIVENSADQTCLIEAVAPQDFFTADARLQLLARSLAPHLPVEELDMLVVKEMGKEYSGTGMDTKVIGRVYVHGVPEPVAPRIDRIVVLRLSPHSYGNALGIGLADITTQSLVEHMDREATYANLLPTTYLRRGKIPPYFPSEKEAIAVALRSLAGKEPMRLKIAIIDNTLHLQEMLVSPAVLEDAPQLELIKTNIKLAFDQEGRLLL